MVTNTVSTFAATTSLASDEGSVRVRCARGAEEGTVIVEVTDTGIGVEPEVMPLLFTEFYQVGDTRVLQKRGTGLGLALTRSFVQLHKGTIEVRSAPGEGSTFTACVPVDYREMASFAGPKERVPIGL